MHYISILQLLLRFTNNFWVILLINRSLALPAMGHCPEHVPPSTYNIFFSALRAIQSLTATIYRQLPPVKPSNFCMCPSWHWILATPLKQTDNKQTGRKYNRAISKDSPKGRTADAYLRFPSRQPAGDASDNLGCHYVLRGPRLPSQLQNVTTLGQYQCLVNRGACMRVDDVRRWKG